MIYGRSTYTEVTVCFETCQIGWLILPEEALAYGLIIGVAAAFSGALIGFVVGVGKLGCASLRFQLWVGCSASSVVTRSSRHSPPSRISSQMARRATRAGTPWLFSRSCSAPRSKVSRHALDEQLPLFDADGIHAGVDRQHLDPHDVEQVVHLLRHGAEAVGELLAISSTASSVVRPARRR